MDGWIEITRENGESNDEAIEAIGYSYRLFGDSFTEA